MQVALDYHGSVDDHPRPQHRLWRRFHFPESQKALFLYQDGRVVESDTLWVDDYVQADDWVAGGTQFITEDTSWQYQVLTDAGYTFVPYT